MSGSVGSPGPTVLANIWWGVSRGIALACLPLLLRMVQIGYVDSRIPGAESPGSGVPTDLAIFALGGGLGLVAGLLRPMGRTFLGSLLFGVVLVEAGVWGLWHFVRLDGGAPDRTTLAATAGFGLLLGAAFYLSQQHEKART
jgi:predicted membrane-bound spermidine synthase